MNQKLSFSYPSIVSYRLIHGYGKLLIFGSKLQLLSFLTLGGILPWTEKLNFQMFVQLTQGIEDYFPQYMYMWTETTGPEQAVSTAEDT